MSRELSYENCVETMTTEIPELRECGARFDVSLPHDAFGTLALFVVDRIQRSDEEDQDLLRRAFSLFNRMAESSDEDIVNLLVVSAIEILADDEDVHRFARDWFSTKAAALFERVLRGWDD